MTRARLTCGDFALELAPEVGGAISRWTHKGRDLFRPALASGFAKVEPRDMASFPMVPYASRLAGGRVAHGGVEAKLPGNMPPETAPLHGLGWRRAWTVADMRETGARMVLSHAAGPDWPWAFEAEQSFALSAVGLTMVLGIANTDSRAFPVSLGFHPYFPRAGARLQAQVSDLWETDLEGIPVGRVRPGTLDALGQGVAASLLTIDNCMEGWDGTASLAWPGMEGWDGAAALAWPDIALEMRAGILGPDGPAPCTRLQLYAPIGQDYFCLEPVTARTNAFNAEDPKGEGTMVLPPGGHASLTMSLHLKA